ncbi:cellulose binding domain-containing protein [Micromonospora sp. NPDC004336]
MSGIRRASSRSYGTTAIASSPWIVVSVGVGVMVVLLVIALGAYRGRGPAYEAQPGPPDPTLALPDPRPSASSPATTSSPSRRESASSSARPSRSVRPTPGPSRTPSPTASASADAVLVVPPSSPSPLSGRYRVVEQFHGGFVAEVQVSNTSSTARGWTARLVFPGGRLGSAWLEGTVQGTASRTEDGFTYRSGQHLAGGASVTLRFHVENADSRPTSCTVDGGACRMS